MPRKLLRYFEPALPILILALCLIGVIFIYSASVNSSGRVVGNTVLKQFIWIFIGLGFFVYFSFTDYKKLESAAPGLFTANIFLLVLVLILGQTRLGAQRWLSIFGFNLQPSELMKITSILLLARFLKQRNHMRDRFSYVVIPFLLLSVPVYLIVKQPDLGSALILFPATYALLYVSGARISYIILTAGTALASMPVLWLFLHDYQKNRIKVFLNPDLDPLGAGYTAIQSKIAVGSGMLTGKGYMSGSQTQLNFLPEKHTDFIFAVISEEWGFLGAFLIIGIYAVLLAFMIKIALEIKDLFCKLVISGFAVMITCHIVVNIGMNIGLLPITGLTLPFVSYGGSSMVMLMSCFGIVENMYARRYMF